MCINPASSAWATYSVAFLPRSALPVPNAMAGI
jgi:hypothetical protein